MPCTFIRVTPQIWLWFILIDLTLLNKVVKYDITLMHNSIMGLPFLRIKTVLKLNINLIILSSFFTHPCLTSRMPYSVRCKVYLAKYTLHCTEA